MAGKYGLSFEEHDVMVLFMTFQTFLLLDIKKAYVVQHSLRNEVIPHSLYTLDLCSVWALL